MRLPEKNEVPGSTERLALQKALDALQSTAQNFAASCIRDASVRMQYLRDIAAASAEFRQAVASGSMEASEAAQRVNLLRNQIMEFSRLRSSPTGRAYASSLKREGLTLGALTEKYARKFFQKPFGTLSPEKQARVYLEIVSSAGRPDPRIVELARLLGKVGQRIIFVSLAIATYEIYEAEDKPREISRQGTLAAASIAGGWGAGAGAVSIGVCAATAPVCVGAAALVGGLVSAFGADLLFGTIYPHPAGR